MKLQLTLDNPYHCLDTSECGHIFDQSGGNIGSNPDSSWVLQGRQSAFPDTACSILVYQGNFCLKMIQGELYVNNNNEPIGPPMVIALNDADHLRLHEYHMSVSLIRHDMNTHWLSTINELVGDETDALLIEEQELSNDSGKKKVELLTLKKSDFELDPLKALNKKTITDDTGLVDEFKINPENNKTDVLFDNLYGKRKEDISKKEPAMEDKLNPLYWLKDDHDT